MSLVISNLTVSFGTKKVLNRIDLIINDGEFVSLVGASGCGKSTLFSTIGGLIAPQSGSIALDGVEITSKRGFIGYMPQDPSLFAWRTVMENAMLTQEINRSIDKDSVDKMLKIAGLYEYKNHYPKALSGGMKQRVSFVRALLASKKILLLDEPFSSLDNFTKEQMQDWLLSLYQSQKRSIFFITHDIEEAIYLSNRIVIMGSDGTIKESVNVPSIAKINRSNEHFWNLKNIITEKFRQAL